jgi:putative transposase
VRNGWIPFKGQQLKRKTKCLRFAGKALRVFEQGLLDGVKWKCGCFAQDPVGDWWLCLPVEVQKASPLPIRYAVGLDLGLKSTVATSDGEKFEAGYFYREIEQKIAQAQRHGHKRKAKRLHRTAARRRKDALHKISRRIIDQYQHIVIGDVSSTQMAKTRMAKSVLDSAWGMLKTQLQYKGQQAGRCVQIVGERNTTRACSSCGALTGPAGLDMLDVRIWMCSECGGIHDRDINAARNILSAGRCPRPSAGTGLRCQLVRRTINPMRGLGPAR